MIRWLLAACALTVTVTVWGGKAEARRNVCEKEPELSLVDAPSRVDDDSAPRLPIEHAVCVPGAGDDAACWDHQALPEHGRGLLLDAGDTFVHGVRAPFLAPTCQLLARGAFDPRPLAEGHERRLERPPRATAS